MTTLSESVVTDEVVENIIMNTQFLAEFLNARARMVVELRRQPKPLTVASSILAGCVFPISSVVAFLWARTE